jgi:hypothetical protein
VSADPLGNARIVNNMVAAFSQAAVELGFRFEPWFSVDLPGGASIKALGLVRQFGSSIGTLVFSKGSEPAPDQAEVLKQAGYLCSVLWPTYGEYRPELFMATLDDWQFFGSPSERPSWYTGKPWS